MRKIFIAAVMASGVGLLTSSPTLAAPVHGIGHAASFGTATEQVHWRWHWRHHRRHHHHYYRHWW